MFTLAWIARLFNVCLLKVADDDILINQTSTLTGSGGDSSLAVEPVDDMRTAIHSDRSRS